MRVDTGKVGVGVQAQSPAAFVSIVGVSRSGTSLLRNVLERSPDVAIANENNYLGHLIRQEGVRYKLRKHVGDLRDDAEIGRLVDAIYSGAFRTGLYRNWGHWRWLRDNVSRDQLIEEIRESDRSERAVFEVALRVYADATGKSIIGEKTPSHFMYVDELLRWFPEGRIVHLIRDPRGNFESELRRRVRQSRHKMSPGYRVLSRNRAALEIALVGITTYAWVRSMRALRWGLENHPDRYLAVRFEDLVAQPEREVRRICDFLGIPFHPWMLDQEVVRKGFNLGQKGFDAGAASRWEEWVSPWIDRWFRSALGEALRELGYL